MCGPDEWRRSGWIPAGLGWATVFFTIADARGACFRQLLFAIIARADGFPPVVGPKGSAQADPITLRAHSCGAALNDGRQK